MELPLIGADCALPDFGSSLFSVECRAQLGKVSRVPANPKGIESISPGLRGTSYPEQDREIKNPERVASIP
jgi:hypothetical protein